MLLAGVAGAALVALSACSQVAPELEPEAATYPETFRSVEELRDAFVEAGGECPSWEQSNHIPAAAESGTCSDSNVLSIYTSKDSTEAAFDNYKTIAQPGASLLVGENWIINDEVVKDLDPALGGVLFTN